MGTSHSKKESPNNSNSFKDAESISETFLQEPPKDDNDINLDVSPQSEAIQKLSKKKRKWTDQEKDKLLKLYQQIQTDHDLYIDLDTLRKNKSSALGRKKPKYIDHQLRIFSDYQTNFNISIQIIAPSQSDNIITSRGGLNNDTDLRKSIISYVEGDIEFHDLMTISMKMFDSEIPSSSQNHHVPIQLLDLYQTIRPSKDKTTLLDPKGKSRLKLIPEKSKRPRSRALIRPIDRQIMATQKDKEDSIPSGTRKIVWSEEFKNSRKPHCYCCHCPLDYKKWHCGHILSRKEGGRIEKENLHPVCVGCNLGMGVNHMYEYILVNQLPGMGSLDYKDPIVIMLQQVSILIHYSWAKIEDLKNSGYITNTEAKKYREMIVSSKKTLSERIAVMINLRQYEMRIPSLIKD
uniref:HNH endonuclease n=1 Tax=Pithovirus LCPAC202 TaxID=2506592 RepID=A0A481Z5L9_9VIRU|nr:MAG: HNH endonuclease [Pithovirus LCPAC202]